jgi:hypothetical protein
MSRYNIIINEFRDVIFNRWQCLRFRVARKVVYCHAEIFIPGPGDRKRSYTIYRTLVKRTFHLYGNERSSWYARRVLTALTAFAGLDKFLTIGKHARPVIFPT